MCSAAFSRPPKAHRRRRNAIRPLMTPVLALALTACGADTGPAPGMVVEDSAGVRIVQHTGTPEAEPPFAFAPEPLYRHGDDPDDYAFARIWRGILLGDGSAAIFDAGSSEVVLLNPDGTFRSVLASGGEGPGEVSRLVTSIFGTGPDCILVLDRGHSRSSLFVNGSLARTTSLLDLRRATSLWPVGIDDAGGFLVATSSFRSGFEGAWLLGHMARYDPETGAIDTVASYKHVPGESNPAPGVGRVFVSDGRFIYVRTDTPEVVWRLADGTVTQIARWPLDPRYMTEEMLAEIEPILRDRQRFANPGASEEEVGNMTSILDVGRGRVLGVVTDEMGVESVAVYELVDTG